MKVIISGGGTGGHIFPALSIANALRADNPNNEILFVGATGRMEMERVPAAGYKIEGLPVAGFDRRRPWRNIPVLWRLYKSLRKARRLIDTFTPDIAIGVGGYASGPILKEAQRRGIPTLIQEQNSYPGVTNKLLAPHAQAICVAYDDMDRFFPAEKIIKTGNPVRADLETSPLTPAQAKKQLGFDPQRPLIVVTGGSLGAATVNQAIDTLVQNPLPAQTQLLWQTGKHYYPQYTHRSSPGIKVQPFITDMATAYRAADIIISRAGAGTISELQNLGKAAILIPSPNVAEDHQRKNALALVQANAALMIDDTQAIAQLTPTLQSIITDPQRLETLRRNISAMAMRQADRKIVEIANRIANAH